LTVHRLSLLNGFTFVSVFFRFQFSKSFSSSVIFQFLTPIYSYFPHQASLVYFLVNRPDYHAFFFQFFVFHKLLVLMR